MLVAPLLCGTVVMVALVINWEFSSRVRTVMGCLISPAVIGRLYMRGFWSSRGSFSSFPLLLTQPFVFYSDILVTSDSVPHNEYLGTRLPLTHSSVVLV